MSCCYPDSLDWQCSTPPCACPENGPDYSRCMKVGSATEAEDRCAALGKRLRTKAEVEAGVLRTLAHHKRVHAKFLCYH